MESLRGVKSFFSLLRGLPVVIKHVSAVADPEGVLGFRSNPAPHRSFKHHVKMK